MADESGKPRQINLRFGKSERDRRLWEWLTADQEAQGTDFNFNDLVKTLLYDWYVARDKAHGAPPLPLWKRQGTNIPLIPAGVSGTPDKEHIAFDPDDDLVQDLISSSFEF